MVFSEKNLSTPLLDFWHLSAGKTKFPKLSKIAEYLFSIPSTSNATERAFNQCRLTMNDLRTSLDPERLDQLMVIKSNYDLCNDFVEMVKLPVNEVTEESEDSEDENDYDI